MAQLKDLPKGEYVKRKPDARTVYRKGDYDRSTKRYALVNTEDLSLVVYLKGTTEVHTNFTY